MMYNQNVEMNPKRKNIIEILFFLFLSNYDKILYVKV